MWSVSPAEMVTIAVVALIVFGPRRLPEIARKAGRVARDLRNAAADLRADIEAEYGDSLKDSTRSLEDARREMRTTLNVFKDPAQALDQLPARRPTGPSVPTVEPSAAADSDETVDPRESDR